MHGAAKTNHMIAAAMGTSNTLQDDDMVSWLHLDDSSCSQLFGDTDRASSSIQQAFPSSGDPMNIQKQRANADAELALAARRASGLSPQIGVESFDKQRTLFQPSTRKWSSGTLSSPNASSTMALPRSQNEDPVNFPQFSISVARVRASMHSEAVAADCTNKKSADYFKNEEATSMESNRSTIDCKSSTSLQQWNDQSLQADTDVSITDPERNCSYATKYSELDSATAKKVHKQAMKTFTSSSGGSGNAGGHNSEKYVPSSLKRKEREVEDTAGCQGNTTGVGYADTKKPSPGRDTTSKRRRAAEVHNLSERRRRDRINERMKALQELIPNSSKTDKASMLDEAIEYLKMLQLQLQVMSMRSGMSISPIIVPTGMPHITSYGGVAVRLVEVSGHHVSRPPHTTLPLHLAATSSSVGATNRVLNGVPSAQLLQGMNMEMYHAHMLRQHQQQQLQHDQEHYQQQQHQIGDQS